MFNNDSCKSFLEQFRKVVHAKPEERLNKRLGGTKLGFLAPNNQYYKAHCPYCAECDYLRDIYKEVRK